jgi:hypothetical protein
MHPAIFVSLTKVDENEIAWSSVDCNWLIGQKTPRAAKSPRSYTTTQRLVFLKQLCRSQKDNKSHFAPRMTSPASPSPEASIKKESISFAPPPPELQLPRLSLSVSSTVDQRPREHPELSHRSYSVDGGKSSFRKGGVLGSPPPPSAYSPRGKVIRG